MGSIISAIHDDYNDYVALCEKLKIEPKDFNEWSYDDLAAVEKVKKDGIPLKQAKWLITLQNKKEIAIKALEDYFRDLDTSAEDKS